uniref:Uncharacterized protein n=1 Tax=Micrurus surinamensis TaxID=129470 RepID=A0A2D4PX78_MICSU
MQVAPQAAVCFSPTANNPASDPQDTGRGGGSNPGGALLAQETMVRRPDGAVSSTSMEGPRQQGFPIPRAPETSRPHSSTISRVEIERERLQKQKLSGRGRRN